jgi:EccD-like transmembrane domain
MPPVTLPSGADQPRDATSGGDSVDAVVDVVRERLDRARVFAAVARTEELLTGLLIGHALLTVAASVVLVAAGEGWGRVLVAVSATALLLRSRLFVTVRQRLPLLTAGLAALGTLGVGLLAEPGGPHLVVLTGVALTAALLTMAAGATYAHRPPSPYVGRAGDLLDTAIVVAVVPVACAVLGLYGRMRGLAG